jgi:hypothetical protein
MFVNVIKKPYLLHFYLPMDFSAHFIPLAHAYLIEGKRSSVEKELLSLLEDHHAVAVHGNPDFWSEQYVTFAIEDARRIKELALQRKMGQGKRVFIIQAEGLTREASNALLKTLEEPGEDTHFFLVLPSARRVLPTILSRVRVVKHHTSDALQQSEKGNQDNSENKEDLSAEHFVKASPSVRMKMVKDLLAQLDKEEISKTDLRNFIEGVLERQRAVMEQSMSSSGAKEWGSLARQTQVASYAEDQSASLKMILEYLALA